MGKTALRRIELKKWFQDEIVAKSKCKCGESHPACIDFHHKDPLEKDNKLSNLVHNLRSKERILAEVAKCEVLCSNCHRKEHYAENEKFLR